MTIFSPEALDRFRALYPERPGTLPHGLTDHPLLALDALVELGRRLPPGQVEYNAGDLPYGVNPAAVRHTGLSVTETIRRIEECGSWMVLKNVESDPAYGALLETALSELAPVIEPVSGEMLTKVAFIFVSSPGAVTPFHLDPEHNVLLHCRGAKTMMVVPGAEDVVTPEMHETYHMGGQSGRNVPWDDGYTARGEAFDLTPGDAIHVPLMWPHWVKNGDAPSVSFSITWRTRWSYQESEARGFNHRLRRIGFSPRSPRPFPRSNAAKSLSHRALRRVGL